MALLEAIVERKKSDQTATVWLEIFLLTLYCADTSTQTASVSLSAHFNLLQSQCFLLIKIIDWPISKMNFNSKKDNSTRSQEILTGVTQTRNGSLSNSLNPQFSNIFTQFSSSERLIAGKFLLTCSWHQKNETTNSVFTCFYYVFLVVLPEVD